MEDDIGILLNFLKSKEWFLLSEILDDMGACYKVIDKELKIIYRKKDNELCKALMNNEECKKRCLESTSLVGEKARRNLEFSIDTCYMDFTEFASPLIVQNNVIGTILGCQIINGNVSEEKYKSNFERYGISKEIFFTHFHTQPCYATNVIENEIKLISLLSRLAIEKTLVDYKLGEKDYEIHGIIDSYKMFEASQNSKLELTEKMVYTNITSITAKALDAEICSLMLIDKEKNILYIEDAVGLDKKVISKVKLKIGEGIVGHVIKSGVPLLVKDIDKDARFGRKHQPKRYYTRSLIISPLKVKGEIIGAISINNKSTRHPFDEEDLELLNIICGHAGAALENLRSAQEKIRIEGLEREYYELKEKLKKPEVMEVKIDKEALKNKDRLIEDLKKKVENLASLRKKTEEEISELKSQREQMEKQLLAEREKLKYYQEELNLLKAAKAEVVEKGTGYEEELEKMKRETEEFKKIYEEIKKVTLLQKEAKREKRVEDVEKYNKILRELQDKKEKLEEMEEKTKELNLLFNVAKGLISNTNPENILRWTIKNISSFYNYHAASYIYKEKNKSSALIKLLYPLSEECIQELKENIQNSWAGLRKSKKITKIDFQIETSEHTSLSTKTKEKISSYIFVPIKERNRIIGLININSIKEFAYSPIDKRLFSLVGNQISLAIERAKLFQKIKDSAERDELTKLYNYRYFERYFEEVFRKNQRNKTPLSLIMVDFDHLKKVNDEYGHAQGNRLIKTVARIIKSKVKNRGVVIRFGGDEFAIVLPGCDQKKAFEIASKIKNRLNNFNFKIKDKSLRLSASMGIAYIPHKEINVSKELFKKADKAVYIAKEQGRDRIIISP
jgi:diguanylate cyclase (GGDEF)-like protein